VVDGQAVRHYVENNRPHSGQAPEQPGRAISRDAGREHHHCQGTGQLDKVIVATHSDQALGLLQVPSAQEQAVLGAIRYQPSLAVLHTDTSVFPSVSWPGRRWNYERQRQGPSRPTFACLLGTLQPLPFKQSVVVSLNS
jgi:predicted NAD/FAD-binding protein